MIAATLALLLSLPPVPLAELDFEMINGHIYVPATVNGRPTTAIVDSGAGMSVMDAALAEKWELPSSGALRARGIGSGSLRGKFLRETSIGLGRILQPLTIAIPLDALAKAEGRPLETVVGYELFAKHLVQIDYPGSKVRIYAQDGSFRPGGKWTPIKLVANHPHIWTWMTVGKKRYRLQTMVDTGASASGLSRKFLAANPLTVRTTAAGVIGGGVGGFIEGRFFRPDGLEIAGWHGRRPVVSMTQTEEGASGSKSTYDLLLGAEVLKRFVVTFDYSGKKLFFEPSGDLDRPFEADKTGLRVFAEGQKVDRFRIVGVLKGSSAERAGLVKDDLIESIDGATTANLRLHQLRETFRAPGPSGWDLGIRRGDRFLKVRLPAKSII